MGESTQDLFGELPALPTRQPAWVAQSLRESLIGKGHITKLLREDPALYQRVLDAVELLTQHRLAAYERAREGFVDAVTESFGWIKREPAAVMVASELLQRHQINLIDLPFNPAGQEISPEQRRGPRP